MQVSEKNLQEGGTSFQINIHKRIMGMKAVNRNFLSSDHNLLEELEALLKASRLAFMSFVISLTFHQLRAG